RPLVGEKLQSQQVFALRTGGTSITIRGLCRPRYRACVTNRKTPSMIQRVTSTFARGLLMAAGALGSFPAMASYGGLNMPVGVTELSSKIHGLHMLILWVCVAIAVAVFGVMIYSLVKFRRSKGSV